MTDSIKKITNYFNRQLRLTFLVGPVVDQTEWTTLSEKTVSFPEITSLNLEATDYLRADLLVADPSTITNKEVAKKLVDAIHEAGSIFLTKPHEKTVELLEEMGMKKTDVPHLLTRQKGHTPKEYDVDYIMRWGDDADFMVNWKLNGELILRHMPKGLTVDTLRVLDVGSLNGYIMESLRRAHVKQVYGTDISYEMGINRIVEPYLLPAITICDFLDNDYPDKFSDMTICMEVLEHIPPKSTEKFVSELGRVTSDRGLILISTSEDWDADETHVNCRKRPEWYALFRQEGFYPYGEQIIFPGFNSFVFKRATSIWQKLSYQLIYWLSLAIPLWGGLRLLKRWQTDLRSIFRSGRN